MILKVIIKESIIFVGNMCNIVFVEPFLGILLLYLWYSHITSFSNDCVCGTSPCDLYFALLYCYHSHFNLVVDMVISCFSVSL